MAMAVEKRERQDRILAELSELGLALAQKLQASAMIAEDVSETAELSLAFQRVSRSVRQTLALEAKFDRDRQTAEREDREVAKRAETLRAARRKAQVRLAVERCVWSEADGDEAENLLSDLDDRLELDTLSDAFAGDDPIEVHIARLCAELGLSPLEPSPPNRACGPAPSGARAPPPPKGRIGERVGSGGVSSAFAGRASGTSADPELAPPTPDPSPQGGGETRYDPLTPWRSSG